MEQICSKCLRILPVEDFPYKDKAQGKRNTHCKECQQAYHRKWFQDNRVEQSLRIKANHDRTRKWMSEYKMTVSCVVCGEHEASCLDFHHLDANKKDRSLAKVAAFGWGTERIQKELSKCVPLCANCHRKFHAGVITLPDSIIGRSSIFQVDEVSSILTSGTTNRGRMV